MQFFTEEMLGGSFCRSRSRCIFKRIGQRIMGFIVYRRIKRNWLLDQAEQIFDFIQVDSGSLSYLLWQWIQPGFLRESCRDTSYLAETHRHMLGEMDQAGLIGCGTTHRLADPPGGIGTKMHASPAVKFLGSSHQPHVSLLDQVYDRYTRATVATPHRNNHAQILFFQLVQL